MTGKLIIFSAPSGSGKTTILKKLLDKGLPMAFSVSAASRPQREGEVDGQDYYFITVDDFKNKIAQNEFLEWEEVYAGSYYGTLKSELPRIWNTGKHVVFDLDVLGGVNVKKMYQDRALAIFIQPPSLQELEKRLLGRSTETPESLQKRLDRAQMELSYAEHFDVIIVNDDVSTAAAIAEQKIMEFLNAC